MSTRTKQVANVLQHELSGILLEIFDEAEFGLITITRVEVFPDLKEAKVFVSAFEHVADLVKILQKRAGFLQKKISPRLTMKRTPQLRFIADTTAEYVEKIEALLA